MAKFTVTFTPEAMATIEQWRIDSFRNNNTLGTVQFEAFPLTAPRPARSPKRLLWARNLQACARRR
jgi:hypothetical protein